MKKIKKFKSFFLFLIGFSFVCPSLSFASEQTIYLTLRQAEKDSRLRQSQAELNYGATSMIQIGSFASLGEGKNSRIIIQFNLSEIPANIRLQNATLKLFKTENAVGDISRTIGVYKVLDSWEEGIGETFDNPVYEGVSWLKKTSGLSWDIPGGDFEDQPISTSTYIPFEDAIWVSWDVTPSVLKILNQENENFGWVLKDEEEDALVNNYAFFYAKEQGGDLRPQLVLSFLPPLDDLDFDRILDSQDLCLGTEIGVKINEKGCSDSQRLVLLEEKQEEMQTKVTLLEGVVSKLEDLVHRLEDTLLRYFSIFSKSTRKKLVCSDLMISNENEITKMGLHCVKEDDSCSCAKIE